MTMRVVCALVVVFSANVVAFAAGGGEPELLPPPRQSVPAPIAALFQPVSAAGAAPRSQPPPSRNDWSLYAPNYMGQMRPRVVQSPYGNYYLYNGAPYYGSTNMQRYLLPKTSD